MKAQDKLVKKIAARKMLPPHDPDTPLGKAKQDWKYGSGWGRNRANRRWV